MKKILLVIFMILVCFTSMNAQQNTTVILGVDNRYGDITRTQKAFQKIIDIINQNGTAHWEVKVYQNQNELLEALKKKEVTIIKMSPLVYSLNKTEAPIIALAVSQNKSGKPFYYSTIFAYKTSPVTSIDQLSGKKIAFGSKFSASSFLIPALYFEKIGLGLKELNYDFVGSQVKIVLKCMEGKYDAGAVREDVLFKLRPGSYRILYKSDPIPEAPLVIRRDLPLQIKKIVADDLKKFSRYIRQHPEIQKNIETDFRYGLSFDFNEEMFIPLRLAYKKLASEL